MTQEKRSQIFHHFAEGECKNVSPLYYKLSKAIAEDIDLLTVAKHCQPRQPIPNLFLCAVHYLLLKNPSEPLAEYYPSISQKAIKVIPFTLFKAFSLANQSAIIEILKTRIVQTNALNRCAYLMPIISSLFEEETAINLIDIGTSAGLNLNFDLYAYTYNNQPKIGNNTVEVASEIKAGKLPYINPKIKINQKIGIDQNPLDIRISENALWLKALIWPDQQARFRRMENAIELAQNSRMILKKGDSIADFDSIIRATTAKQPLIIYHTHVLYQFILEERKAFWIMLDKIGMERDFYYIAAESASILAHDYQQKGVLVELITYQNGQKMNRLMAITNGHANWIKWVE